MASCRRRARGAGRRRWEEVKTGGMSGGRWVARGLSSARVSNCPPARTRKKDSMSASVPASPSALKVGGCWGRGRRGSCRRGRRRRPRWSASEPTSPSQLKSAEPQRWGRLEIQASWRPLWTPAPAMTAPSVEMPWTSASVQPVRLAPAVLRSVLTGTMPVAGVQSDAISVLGGQEARAADDRAVAVGAKGRGLERAGDSSQGVRAFRWTAQGNPRHDHPWASSPARSSPRPFAPTATARSSAARASCPPTPRSRHSGRPPPAWSPSARS